MFHLDVGRAAGALYCFLKVVEMLLQIRGNDLEWGRFYLSEKE